MKGGQLLGGIAIGALLGIGVGYLLGVDSEKRNQWIRMISTKVLGGSCDCEAESLLEEALEGDKK